METTDYLKLKKKEDKTEVEWELLKSVQALRAIGEIVTDTTKERMSNGEAIRAIRERLMR
jgi:hypothetical protein